MLCSTSSLALLVSHARSLSSCIHIVLFDIAPFCASADDADDGDDGDDADDGDDGDDGDDADDGDVIGDKL